MYRGMKRMLSLILSATLMVGNIALPQEMSQVQAEEVVRENEIGVEGVENQGEGGVVEKNWYAKGRPMTEEELKEEYELIEKYHFQTKQQPEVTDFYIEEIGEVEQSVVTENLIPMNNVMAQEEGEEESLPSAYSLLDYQQVAADVRDQGDDGICWIYSSLAGIESSMIKNHLADTSIDLSEPHTMYYRHRPVGDPLGGTQGNYANFTNKSMEDLMITGGQPESLGSVFATGMGPVKETDFYSLEYIMAMDRGETLNDVEKAYGNKAAIITEAMTIQTRNRNVEEEIILSDRNRMKRTLIEYGGFTVNYNSGGNYYNAQYAAQYCNVEDKIDHAVLIVGWDDHFPKENFMIAPEGDGAWLVRNSWGEEVGIDGYFWLSYYDKSVSQRGTFFKAVSKDFYDNNYQYDEMGTIGDYLVAGNDANNGKVETANAFTIQKEQELLKSISFYLYDYFYQYEVQIYKNPITVDPTSGQKLLDTPLTGKVEGRGFYTAELQDPILLSRGDVIAVVVGITSQKEGVTAYTSYENIRGAQEGESFYKDNNGQWRSCAESGYGNFSIKAQTKTVDQEFVHTHTWEEEWSGDSQYHWHECTGQGTCDAGHSTTEKGYEKHYGDTATCMAAPVCQGCQMSYGYLDPDAHQGTTQCIYCEKAMPVNNPEFSFVSVSEQQVFSKVSGNSKVLIFFDSNDQGTKEKIKELVKKNFIGIDVLAIETSGASKEELSLYLESIDGTNSNLVFCYEDATDTIRNIADTYTNEYQKVYPAVVAGDWPQICYTNKKNQVSYMTFGNEELSVEAIEENLKSYCGYRKLGKDIDNPCSEEFMNIDDVRVSLSAEGKPKVIIFFNDDEGSRSTIENFMENPPEGVDFMAIHSMGVDKARVEEFAASCNISEDSPIEFCYGNQLVENPWATVYECISKYREAMGYETGTSYSPMICYIDGNNKFQYATEGVSGTAQDLNSMLYNYCGYTGGNQPEEPPVEPPIEPVKSLEVTAPVKKVYLVGEELDLTGGMVKVTDQEPVSLSMTMISDFDRSSQGEKTITVSYEELSDSFTILVINKPVATATEGMTLEQVELPQNQFGTFSWLLGETVLDNAGEQIHYANFLPSDSNYEVRERVEVLVTVEEKETTDPEETEEYFTVTFEMNGYGETIESYTNIKEGTTITEPSKPTAEGYLFEGWYTDTTFSRKWDFSTDTVTEDLTLYAKWTEEKNEDDDQEGEITQDSIRISKIEDLIYNGKAQKPVIEIYDGETLLKKNKDYTISYSQNVASNRDSIAATGVFDATLPTITIKGKGNYTGSRQINFNILKAVIGNETKQEAAGVKISYNDQLVVNTKKEVKPFKSITLGRKLKEGIDYTVSVNALQAKNDWGEELTGELAENKIPKGVTGTFLLTIEGIGNYQGILEKTITVGEKATLLKNATITLKKEYRSLDLKTFRTKHQGRLPEGAFTVTMAKAELKEGRDYSVSYQETEKTGKAKLVIQGIGVYGGSKTVTFKLTGKPFTASKLTIENFGNLTFTGEELTHKDLVVKYEGKVLTEGTDYTISYTKNNKVGTATMMITAKEGSFYQGSIKKTFKIVAADITKVKQVKAIFIPYSKAGARPVAEVVLENALGQTLENGKDYTLSYKNNQEVAEANGSNGPVIIVKGKGNYTGTLEIPFTITSADLANCNITVKAVAYNAKKADSYAYQPVVTIKDGNKTLSSKTDFSVKYVNNTQAAYQAYYIDKVEGAPRPSMIITDREGSNYIAAHVISMALPVYRVKLTAKNIYAVISEASYTGKQQTPAVEVYYSADKKGIKDAKSKGLTSQKEIEALGLVKLSQADYQVSYGTNILGGGKKGSLKIEGRGALYGGSVTLKFHIGLRDLTN